MKIATLCYIENEKNEILMLHRVKKQDDMHEGFWVAPGGKVEFNETPLDAVKREIKEETGLILNKVKLKAVLTFPDTGNTPFKDLWYVFTYMCNDYTGSLTISPEGNLKWIRKEDLLNLPMWEGDKVFTPLLFKKGVFEMESFYDGEKLVKHSIEYV